MGTKEFSKGNCSAKLKCVAQKEEKKYSTLIIPLHCKLAWYAIGHCWLFFTSCQWSLDNTQHVFFMHFPQLLQAWQPATFEQTLLVAWSPPLNYLTVLEISGIPVVPHDQKVYWANSFGKIKSLVARRKTNADNSAKRQEKKLREQHPTYSLVF